MSNKLQSLSRHESSECKGTGDTDEDTGEDIPCENPYVDYFTDAEGETMLLCRNCRMIREEERGEELRDCCGECDRPFKGFDDERVDHRRCGQ